MAKKSNPLDSLVRSSERKINRRPEPRHLDRRTKRNRTRASQLRSAMAE